MCDFDPCIRILIVREVQKVLSRLAYIDIQIENSAKLQEFAVSTHLDFQTRVSPKVLNDFFLEALN